MWNMTWVSGKKSMYNIINDLYIRIVKNHTSKQSKKDKSKNQKSILSLGFVQVQNSLPSINNSNISEKKDEIIDNNSKELEYLEVFCCIYKNK